MKRSSSPSSASNFYLTESDSAAELAPLHTFLFEHGEVIGRSSLRFKLLFNRKAILRRSSLRFTLFYSNTEKSSGGARSASNFYLTESNSAAEFAPLHAFIGLINISTEKMLRFDNCPLLFLRISGKMIITNIFEPHSKDAAAFR